MQYKYLTPKLHNVQTRHNYFHIYTSYKTHLATDSLKLNLESKV